MRSMLAEKIGGILSLKTGIFLLVCIIVDVEYFFQWCICDFFLLRMNRVVLSDEMREIFAHNAKYIVVLINLQFCTAVSGDLSV
jgi:hypothetical protein